MMLSIGFLGEYVLLKQPALSGGIAISILALFLLIRREKQGDKTNKRVYPYVISFCLIWGSLTFLMKMLSNNSLPVMSFLAYWYLGSFLGALTQTKLGILPSGTNPNLWPLLLLSVCVLVSLGLTYWSYSVVPMIVAQPLFLLGEALIPTLIGLAIFREKVKGHWLLMLMALIGGILIILGAKGVKL
jgi:drug/metabolite transporter (DMT)-like permease